MKPKLLEDNVEYFHYYFTIPDNIQLTKESFKTIKTHYSIDGASKIKSVETFPWRYNDVNIINNDFLRQNFVLDLTIKTFSVNQD